MTILLAALSVAAVTLSSAFSIGIISPFRRDENSDLTCLAQAMALLIGTHLLVGWALGGIAATVAFLVVLFFQVAPWTWGSSQRSTHPTITDNDTDVTLSAAERSAWEDLSSRI